MDPSESGQEDRAGGRRAAALHDARRAAARDGAPMIGDSPAFLGLKAHIARIAATDAPVLIEGETGSGKELAARSIHYLGARADRPFVALNCGAIPDNLVEAELFGHARGAFTDAHQERAGVVAQANGGTLFLDEIDALSPKAQVALLRFLQDHRFRRVGQDRELFCDARVIAASNRPLASLVAAREFREDLLYRIDILHLRIPSLREREGDAALLARHYLHKICAQYGLPAKRVHPDTLRWLDAQQWPGNVRQLENFIHRNALLCDGPELCMTPPTSSDQDGEHDDGLDFQRSKAHAIACFEKRFLARVLARTGGNVAAAARLMGKDRRAVGKLIKKHGIDRLTFGG
jgi:two-component system response regulator GlrR